MKIRTNKIAPLALTVALAFGAAACDDGSGQDVEQSVEEGAEDAEQGVEEGADEAEQQVEEGAEESGETTDEG